MFVWAGSANCPQGGVGCLHECPTETVACDFQDQRLVMLVSQMKSGLPVRFSFSYLIPWFSYFRMDHCVNDDIRVLLELMPISPLLGPKAFGYQKLAAP